ncbi:tyramine receptor Ser-2 [Biomphalaria pfeifferi]|uniref:Tyramine receptor Ser-2 n=1 Tax=Biomphalaria pfeifferi TaxID=112525 RepID=A0AAD8B225_BIOPF|nr:tyramine receptor Ser-2 [Biomphalaria pfeifferi]
MYLLFKYLPGDSGLNTPRNSARKTQPTDTKSKHCWLLLSSGRQLRSNHMAEIKLCFFISFVFRNKFYNCIFYLRIGCAIREHGKNVNERNSSQATAQVSKGVAVPHTKVKVTHWSDTTKRESSLAYGVDDTSESVDATVTISDLSDINTVTIPNNSIRTIVENCNVNKSTSSENPCKDSFSKNKIALDGIITKQRLDTFKKSSRKQGGALKKQQKQLNRTHLMMLTVTLVFFLGFLPYLCLNVLLVVSPETVASLKGWSLVMYQFFLDSCFVNLAANPVIYSLLDQKFKTICINMLKNKH